MMLGLPRNTRYLSFYLVLALGLVSIFVYYRSPIGQTIQSTRAHYTNRPGTTSKIKPANSTLGFGGLYVVSGPGSPRRGHLEQQAAITGLNLTIPEQISWTDEDVADFRWPNISQSKVGVGSTKAWLSHHLVLKAFLESGLETALIFEDDVDWDVRLRTIQVPLAQNAARQVMKVASAEAAYPWGRNEDWDLLYLGHCGDYFNDLKDGVGVGHVHPHDLNDIAHVIYDDPTILPFTDLHPWTTSLLTALSVPEHKRVVHQSKWPLCSFGYAVTRECAKKILEEVAPPKEDIMNRDNVVAYDAALLEGCRDNWMINCYTVNPELFHHMEGQSLIASESEAAEHKKVYRPPVDVRGSEQVWWRKETSNINCGFWSGEFYYDDEPEKLEILKEEIGRKGRCMKVDRE